MTADFSFLSAPALTVPTGTVDFSFAPAGGAPSGTLAATLSLAGAIAGTFALPTFVGTLGAVLAVDGALALKHGAAGVCSAVLPLPASIAGLHPRYHLHGELRDAGALVTAARRVRAHRRSDGAVVGQVDTSSGIFDIPVGYEIDEFYLVPLDMSSDAADWLPPVANRVLSVLVTD